MKKVWVLMSLLTLFLSANTKMNEKLRKEALSLGMSSTQGCKYVAGKYEIVKNSVSYDVTTGFLSCLRDPSPITVFEAVVEEEDRVMVFSIGDISILKRRGR